MADAAGKRENRQELRLALALRGGASMAVWIGGAVAEINHLRDALTPRNDPAEPSVSRHPWAVLAKLAGYDSVSVDVLAGASAGGINATLLSTSLVYGLPFDRMREMWVRCADVEAMARPVPKFWQRGPVALLEGDDYFRAEFERTITDLVPPADQARDLGARADLLLTATLLDPVWERRFDGRAETILQPRRRAWFRFRHRGRPGDPLSDFGAGDDFASSVRRLAHAGRATSSYPAAFEPARVYSGTGEPPAGVPNMFGVFSEVNPPAVWRPFRVVDGGVLDNIPVTAAIHAVAAAPADRPTQRWLLYLSPEAEKPSDEKPPGRLALPVATAALRARITQESLLSDIEALEDHNAVVARTALRRKALFAELRDAPQPQRTRELARQSDARRPEHAVVRAELDAQAVHRLLTEPAGIEDGRLLPPISGDPLAGWSAHARTALADHLSTCLARQATVDPDGVFDDVWGLFSRVEECLGWARDAQRWASETEVRELGRCRVALYRLRVFTEVLEAHADRYWVNGAVLEPIVELAELDGWVDRAVQRRRRLQHHLPSPIRPLLTAVLAELEADDESAGERFQRGLEEFAAELLSIVESSGADAVLDSGVADDDADHVDAVAAGVEALHRVTSRIAGAAPAREHWNEPEQIGYGLLEHADDQQRAAVLRQLVVLTAPLDVGRAPGSHIEFLRVVSDSQTPLPFTSLRSTGETLLSEDKVRGGDLGNFASFLSAKWRANDWMWGRMDAAANLVTLLADPCRLVRYNDDPDELGDAVQAVVSSPAEDELGALSEAESKQWRDFLAGRWAAHAGDVRAELEALFARPADAHPLTETRKALTERLQWTIAARELPFVAATPAGAAPEVSEDITRPAAPKRLEADVADYSVGRQRLRDLGEQRVASVATRLSLIGYRAAKPSPRGALNLLLRLGMTVLKPVLLVVAFAAAAPTRAALVGFLAATAAGITTPNTSALRYADRLTEPAPGISPGASPAPDVSWVDNTDWWTVAYLSGHGSVPVLGALPVVVFALWLGWQLAGRVSGGHGLARWLPALFCAAVLLAASYWLMTTGLRLGPLGLTLIAVALTWLATFAYRPAGRFAATVVTAAAFAVVMCLGGVTASEWITAAGAAAAYAQMVLLSSVDVLRPRPRPDHGEG